MNYLLKYWRTKVYQPINQPKNVYFKFPYSHEATSGIMTLADNSTTKLSVVRNNDAPPKDIETPYFTLVAEVENFNQAQVKNVTLALFQEKDDALMALAKFNRALQRPAWNLVKKALFGLFILFIFNFFYILALHSQSNSGFAGLTPDKKAALDQKIAQLLAARQLQQAGNGQGQVGALPGQQTLPPNAPQAQQPQEVDQPGADLLNALKDKK